MYLDTWEVSSVENC